MTRMKMNIDDEILNTSRDIPTRNRVEELAKAFMFYISVSDSNTQQSAIPDNCITGHWGEDAVTVLGNLYDAAHALLAHIDIRPYRLTAETFGAEAEQAKRLIKDLRDALAEVEG